MPPQSGEDLKGRPLEEIVERMRREVEAREYRLAGSYGAMVAQGAATSD